ncbi:uncharacterized protein PITG_09083 [Phytophthora infestans T30-4]|uniref:Uncharacterized protein n=1 Tax=Phytophthora infestans (strain T30-4) TaxID=403677 RepID=D0NBN4_PHYIT|nr:uncharacterized protein PITG_09083 [Phytophthora infestans T30-4]EEY55189.1 conserved hypothetical protein [Phytophthora infestans T30-4]|eukprot:XP_002903413.1 conserved hypothetical protein [Phytophthora infestans T30-4]
MDMIYQDFSSCFFFTSTPTFSHKQHLRLLELSQAEEAICDIFSSISAADVRQQAGQTDKNAGQYHGDKAGKWPKPSEDVAFFTLSVNSARKEGGLRKLLRGADFREGGNAYAKLSPAGVDHAYTKRLPAASRQASQEPQPVRGQAQDGGQSRQEARSLRRHPKTISDPVDEEPEDWDDEGDGDVEPTMIENLAYKSAWKPKLHYVRRQPGHGQQ